MDLRPSEVDLVSAYLQDFTTLAGDRRTARLLAGTVRGIIGSESLVCSRMRPFPPALAAGRHSERRIRRMARGETTQRSDLNPASLIARLQARGVAQLSGAAAIWVALDGSDLRKPQAREMAHLQPVKSLDGGFVPGYRTLNALGIGGDGSPTGSSAARRRTSRASRARSRRRSARWATPWRPSACR